MRCARSSRTSESPPTSKGDPAWDWEAQCELVNAYALRANCVIVAEFIEVETGKRNDRPELEKAIAWPPRGTKPPSSSPSWTGWPVASTSSRD